MKSSIRRSLGFVGVVEARYKHFMVFQSLYELNKIKTISEYAKKGVQIEAINSRIFSNGEVWLPTNEQYLQ